MYFSDSSWSWMNLCFKTLLINLLSINYDSNYDPIIMKFPLDFSEMVVAKLITSLKMKGNERLGLLPAVFFWKYNSMVLAYC